MNKIRRNLTGIILIGISWYIFGVGYSSSEALFLSGFLFLAGGIFSLAYRRQKKYVYPDIDENSYNRSAFLAVSHLDDEQIEVIKKAITRHLDNGSESPVNKMAQEIKERLQIKLENKMASLDFLQIVLKEHAALGGETGQSRK